MSAPQVTPADVEAAIASEHYFTALQGCAGQELLDEVQPVDVPDCLALLTFCVLVTRNSHTVTGEAYCADPAKFNAETGRIEARKAAINKLWPMVVYAERERLAAPAFIELKGEFSAEEIAKFKAYWERMVSGGAE